MTTNGFVQEMEQEYHTTRRMLERLPEDELAWRPHPKSMSLGQLALHVGSIPGNIAEMAKAAEVELPRFQQAEATSVKEVLEALDDGVRRAGEILAGFGAAELAGTWRVVDGDREVLAMPRGLLIRSILLNHWYHHRGQLAVYLRLLDVPVPSVYGPTADEDPFAVPAA